jgi:hypothetical protein
VNPELDPGVEARLGVMQGMEAGSGIEASRCDASGIEKHEFPQPNACLSIETMIYMMVIDMQDLLRLCTPFSFTYP